MVRKSTEIYEELNQMQNGLIQLLSKEGSIIWIDLDYYAKYVNDLKHELRLALANES